jgi:hypothetical protein
MMTNRKGLLLSLSAVALIGLCNCESTKVNSTGVDAEGRESAWDKQTDLDNAEASKLNDLEQMDVTY